MTSTISWIVFTVCLIFAGVCKAASPNCTLIINELQLPLLPTVTSEFIELQASPECFVNSTTPFSLTNYTLLLWHGANEANKPAKLLNRAIFNISTNVNCTQMNGTLLVIGSPLMNNSQIPQFCPFTAFGKDWEKGSNPSYIDKGRQRTNALVLYENLNSTNMKLNETTLTNATANRDKIADLIFFAKEGKHTNDIVQLLFPDYKIGTKFNVPYFRMDDRDTNGTTPEEKHSFSFCCDQSIVPGKWPPGFRWSKPTPGILNNCTSEYVLDPKGSTYKLSIDRCNVSAMTDFGPPKPPKTTPAPPIISTTAQPAPASTVGRTVGIVLGVCLAGTIAIILALYAIGHIKRRRYGQPGQEVPNERCFSLKCLQRNEDADRLVIDN